jgi:hypothetical protein
MKKYVDKEALKTGVKTFGVGLVVGGAAHGVQEGVNAIVDSVADDGWTPSNETTELLSTDGKQSITVPENLNDSGKDLLKQMMEDGSLSKEELGVLESKGWTVSSEATGSVQEVFLSEEFDDVTRDFWYDNKTPRVYDYTELKTHWTKGGDNFTIAPMLEKLATSSNGESLKISTDNVKAFLVPNGGDSGQALAIDINPDGTLDLTDELKEEMFSTHNGKNIFHGKYLEIAEVVDSNDGVTHIRPVSTVVGKGDMGDVLMSVLDENGESIHLTPPSVAPDDVVPFYVPFTTLFNKYKHMGALKKDEERSDASETPENPDAPLDSSVIVVADEDEKKQGEKRSKTKNGETYGGNFGETIVYFMVE